MRGYGLRGRGAGSLMPVSSLMIHSINTRTRIGMIQEVTIMTASVSMKRFRMSAALSVRFSADSESRSRMPLIRP